jgi:hypothetical protein
MRLGSDPEVFLQDGNGKPISSIGYIGADKWNPFQIPDMPAGFTLQEDNVSLEYGIPPCSTPDEFVHHIQAVMEKSREYVKGLSFSKLSCIIFPEDQMNHPDAHVFGCEPDFDAWTKEINPKPRPPHPLMRSAGGHVHVETKNDPIISVRAMDLCLAIPSLFMDSDGDKRRQLYGKRGAFRPKPYGFEYRTLSNYWIFDEKLIRWVWRNVERALDIGDVSKEDKNILQAINNNDKKVAEKLVKKYQLEVL